jgi:hypothetical protein
MKDGSKEDETSGGTEHGGFRVVGRGKSAAIQRPLNAGAEARFV